MISAELDELFDHPPRTFGPTPLWWWSGAPVTADRLAWQLERYDEGGIHNLVVINLAPAGPLFGAHADDPAWFSETWWDRFTQACDLAAERDMTIWFYDQIGFSGANLQGAVTQRVPDAAGLTLTHRIAVVEGGTVPLKPAESLLGAYRLDDGGRLDVDAGAGGGVDAADGTSMRLVLTAPTAFDYLSADACRLLIDTVHGAYDRRVPQHLGATIPGSFQDELPGTNAWTPRFAAEFSDRRGYDLLDHLPALFVPGEGHAKVRAAKVRGDYYAVRAALTEEAFFRPLAQWHTDRGMIIGADQSNPARAGFPTQSTQIYTDYFRTHRWYGAAGSDHEGDAKVHSSMAHLYDHDRVWIESFHSSGWGGTLEDTYDWLLPLLRSGANLYNPHASYFGTAGGWFEWAPPSTDWRQPYWGQYPAFANAVARIAALMTWGDYDVEVAVLHPTTTAQAGLTLDLPTDHFGEGVLGGAYAEVDAAQQAYLALSGVNNWFDTRPGALDRAGVAFDVIDDDSVQRGVVADGSLAVGALRYRAVVLPAVNVLETGTAARLLDLLDAGGRVLVVGSSPRYAAGVAGDDDVVAALAAHPELEVVADAEAAAASLCDRRGHAVADVPLLVRRRDRIGIALVTGAFPNASAYPLRDPGQWLWTDHDFDPARYAGAREVEVAAEVDRAEVWDPATGRRWPARVAHDAGRSRLAFETGGAPAVLVVWDEVPPGELPNDVPGEESPAVPGTSTDVSDGWTGELVPTMDNRWGDLALPLGTDTDRLQVWDFAWSEAGIDREVHARATYGNRVRVSPVASVDGPDSLSATEVTEVLAGRRPLAADDWTRGEYSTSRGIEKPGYGALGNKGVVPEEFVRVPSTAAGEVVHVRAVVESELRGEAELVVAAGAEKQIWWNGEPVHVSPGHRASGRVEVVAANVLEYRLGADQNVPPNASFGERTLGSSFTLTRPGTAGTRPVLIGVGDLVPDGTVTFRADVSCPADASAATLVVGSAAGLTVSIDGAVVGRQAKVQYYESSWGATPAYFCHDVTDRLGAGEHRVEIVLDSADPADVLFVDLAVQTSDGLVVRTSGPDWEVETGGVIGSAVEHLGSWGELAPMQAARRPHPLPDADWLEGPAEDGTAAPAFRTTDDVVPRAQEFTFVVPAGTVELELPLLLSAVVEVAGTEGEIGDDPVRLDQPTAAPTPVVVRTGPTVFRRGGSAWAGPVRVTTTPAPVTLGDWRERGLGSWSGAVNYRRTITVGADVGVAVLDLGRVRGSVAVRVDGEPVAELFCAPYRVDLGDRRGDLEVMITVANTLAPFLDASTPTAWVFPSQLASGLFGPVTLQTG